MNKQRRKIEKAKKREIAVREKSLIERTANLQKKKLEEYPNFVVLNRDADERFIAEVLKATKKVDFSDKKKLGNPLQRFLRSGKELGFKNALMNIDSLPPSRPVGLRGPVLNGFARRTIFLCQIGELVYQQIPVEVRKKYIPFNDVSIEPNGNAITLRFSCVSSVSGEFGRIFFSPREPKIEFDGATYRVAFSNHAIARVCERVNPEYYHYSTSGDVFALLKNCIYYEPTKLLDGSPAFAVFNICGTPGFVHYQTYCINVFGEENLLPNAGEVYYRVGYCPVTFEKGFAKAMTFLPPGFSNTPEYGLFSNSGSYRTDNRSLFLRSTADDRCLRDQLYWNDSELSKFFHQNGVPQVFQWKHQVFDYR